MLAANRCIPAPFSREELLELCLQIEGHADDAIAAFVGGLVVLSAEDGKILWRRYDLPPMQVCIVVPNVPWSTRESRSILPEKINLRDGVFNLGRSLLVADALRSADYRLLSEAMKDRLHQPYRLARLPGVEDILLAARQAGAAAAALSGAGPGVIAFAKSGHPAILRAMEEAARAKGLNARGYTLRISNLGADGAESQPIG